MVKMELRENDLNLLRAALVELKDAENKRAGKAIKRAEKKGLAACEDVEAGLHFKNAHDAMELWDRIFQQKWTLDN